MGETITAVPETAEKEIERIFNLQRAAQYEVARRTAKQRKAKLKELHKAVLKYREEIKTALYKDYRKHPSEVDLTEIYPVTTELKHAIKDIGSWTKTRQVPTPLALMGSRSFIKYEPKGVVLIISPWNFPLNLTFGPLVTAIAAGNTVIIKPSESTRHISKIMKKIVSEIFDEKEVALVEGGIPTSTALLKLPFNHIFFTGAPSIGKIVMTAAAKNLCSVTLELGGKSPTIVDETASIATAARRIAWSKFVNNGQVCIAPDHVYVHKSKKDTFVATMNKYLKEFYTEDASKESSYARIVNAQHHDRINAYLKDAVDKGAKIESGGQSDAEQNYIAPTLVSALTAETDLLQKEIFGPVLPIIEYTDINEVIHKINADEKPLALYVYSDNKKNIKHIISNTRAGGSCINHSGVHYYNSNLPFGGSNNSGIGKAHGWYGFQAFSNARAVLKQDMPNALELLLPPYNKFKQRIIDLTIKYF